MRLITDQEILDLTDYLIKNPAQSQCRPAFAWMKELNDRIDGLTDVGALLPWSKTHSKIRIRPGEVSLWAGVNGHGKSLMLGQVMLDLAFQGHRCVIASMEMQPAATIERMAYQALGFKDPTKKAMLRFLKHIFFNENDGLYLYAQNGMVDPKMILALARYSAYKIKASNFVIDSLMKCGINGDDYNAQKWFVDNLCSIASDTGIHIHLVCHSRKKETEKRIMDKFDIKGSGDISDMADNIYTVFRNKDKEKEARKPPGDQNEKIMERPDAILNCDKQRNGDWEGMISLWHDKRSGQFVADSYGKQINYAGKILDQQENCEA